MAFSYVIVFAKTTNLQDLKHPEFASYLKKKEYRFYVVITFTFFYNIS